MKLRHLYRLLIPEIKGATFVAVALLALAGSGTVLAQEYRLKQFRVEDGLPSNVIKAIAQDSSGFFWIATDEGVVKFDGHAFTSYKGPCTASMPKFRPKPYRQTLCVWRS
ncbi:MAG: two-component regulator propeller domain-containing protein [Bacteroidota bacterium]